jgi:hypothetical protein
MREGQPEQSAPDAICDCFWFVANSSLTPKSGYVRVGGDPPATQESAFQWIEKFSMIDMAISR